MATPELTPKKQLEWQGVSESDQLQDDTRQPSEASEAEPDFRLTLEIGPPEACWSRGRWLMLADKALNTSSASDESKAN